MAQPGQHFITSYLDDRELLPGFREGMENVAADEQRHIGFGVKLLSDLRRMDPDVPYAVADLLREVIPYTASVLVPPDWDMRYVECFGFTRRGHRRGGGELARDEDAQRRDADRGAARPARVPRARAPPRERAERGYRMVRAGYLGEKEGPPSTDPGDMRAPVRDDRRRPRLECRGGARHDPVGLPRRRAVARGGGQRRHPRRARAAPTRRAWCSARGSRTSSTSRRAVATRARWPCAARLRPRGDLRWLWRSRRMFPK